MIIDHNLLLNFLWGLLTMDGPHSRPASVAGRHDFLSHPTSNNNSIKASNNPDNQSLICKSYMSIIALQPSSNLSMNCESYTNPCIVEKIEALSTWYPNFSDNFLRICYKHHCRSWASAILGSRSESSNLGERTARVSMLSINVVSRGSVFVFYIWYGILPQPISISRLQIQGDWIR